MRISDWSSDVCSSDLQAHIFGKQGSTSIVGQPACRPPIQAPAITTHVRGQVEHVLQRLPKAYAGSGPNLFALSVQIRHFRVVTHTKAPKASWAARSRRRRSKTIGIDRQSTRLHSSH